MLRKVTRQVQGHRTKDGAGVSLVRVLGIRTTEDYDPFLMLDSFDSTDPADYTAGFPMHPHRGIETFTFLSKGGDSSDLFSSFLGETQEKGEELSRKIQV